MDAGWLDVSRSAVEAMVEVMEGRVASIGVREAHAQPDGELIAGFDAMVAWAGYAPCPELFFVATNGTTGDCETWRYPSDPCLPGLAAAVDPAEVAAFLSVPVVSLEVVTLRPCRRAVVRARGAGVDVHLKVVTPASVPVLVERHRAFGAAGVLVPDVVAADVARGWVALGTLSGRTLDQCLDSDDSPLITAEAVWSLVESITPVQFEPMMEVPAASTHAARHARLISGMLPALHGRVRRLVRDLGTRPHTPRVGTVHGDLHPGQLLVDEVGGLVGVLDIDGSGTGDPLDDIGRMVAHLMVAAEMAHGDGSRRWHVAGRLIDTAGSRATADELSHRIAASVVTHSIGPWRAQTDRWPLFMERLVTLAEQVLDVGAEATIRSRRSP